MSARVTRLSILLVAFAVACGGAQHPSPPTIDDLRRRAEARPEDPDAQAALAEAELLMRGGDAARAQAQIARARALRDDLGLVYLAGVERELHGDPSAALDLYLEAVTLAARSDDPRAAAVAHVAAAEVQSLDDSVARYAERVEGPFAAVHAAPGDIGDSARATIGELLIDLAYRRADLARVAAILEAERCVTEWRVAGPFGPRTLLGFDGELTPDADDALAASYDLGPGRGQRATRDVHGRGCNVHIGAGPVAGGGTTFAEATVEVPEGGRWVVRLETPNAVTLDVDGARVASIDRRREALGRASFHPVELTAGSHRLRARVSTRHPNPVLSLGLSRTAGPPGGAALEGDGLLTAYLRAQRAMVRGDVVGARERVRPHLHRDGSAVFLIAGAAAALNDPLRGSEVRHDTARRLLGWAAERDEGAWYPTLTLAQLEANEGRTDGAVAALRAAMERWPALVVIPLQLLDYLEQRGWHAQADEVIARAAELAPDACRPRRAMLHQAQRRHRADDSMDVARSLVECDARSDAMLRLHVARREWEPALAEVARLAALEPEESSMGELQAQLEIARARSDDAEVQRLLGRLRERAPQSDLLVLAQADRLLAADGAQAARAHLVAALTAEPESMVGLRRPLWAMGGAMPLESFRRDGREVIREFEGSGRVYQEPMVLVLDHTVYRVFEDGSMLELTHNIFRLSSQEAVDQMGEYAVPEHAQMLTLHTVKADGTRLEPDEIAGKDTISFPSLSPGDYIEFEYVRPHPAPNTYPRAVLGERFYFRNYATPFDLSQLTVVTPRDLRLTVDPRGAAPETVERVEGDTRVHQWTARESRPFEQVEGSIPAREFFPSVYWGHGATWAMYVETLRDLLADRDMRDPAAARVIHDILGHDQRGSVEQRAARLHRWVLENVEDTDDLFGSAPAMLASRTGNRTRVFHYLLRMAGIDADIAVARSFTGDRTEGTLADDETFVHLVVRLRGTEGWMWTHAGARGSPFGYLPSNLAGMEALLLDATGARVTLPERPLETDLRTVNVDVELRRDGGARIAVVETFRGGGAVLWRNQLDQIPEARIEDQFESLYVANLLPGADLRRLVITGREDPDLPLTLRYEVEVRSLARRDRSGGAEALVVPPIYRARLAPQFAHAPSRSIAQLVGSGLALDVEVLLRTPEGSRVAQLPEPEALTSVHGARAEVATERTDDGVRVRRTYRIPRMRVAPNEYGEFAAFCRRADAAESAELRLGR